MIRRDRETAPAQEDWSINREGEIVIERQEGSDEAVVRLSVSSETPILTWRMWNDRFQRVWEILDHSESAIIRTRIKDGMPLFDQHRGDQVGIIPEPKVTNKKLGGVPVFGASQRSQDIKSDVINKIRRNLSIDGAVDPKSLKLEGEKDGVPILRAKRWEPTGASFVGVAADPTVGVDRQHNPNPGSTGVQVMAPENTNNTTSSAPAPAAAPPQNPPPSPVDMGTAVRDATTERDKEVVQMMALARTHKIKNEILDKALAENKSMADFQNDVLRALANGETDNGVAREPQETDANIGMTKKEIKRFSFCKAILSRCSGSGEKAEFEMECSKAVADKIGREAGGFFVPMDVMRSEADSLKTWQYMLQRMLGLQRDLQIGGEGTGSFVVSTDLLSGSFIELLRNKMIATALGAQTLMGLVGDVAIPKQTAASTAYWVSEGVAVTESEQTLGQITGTPHTIGALSDVTRKLLKQSSIDVENFVRGDIATVVALGIDLAMLNGTGTDGQPLGLINTDGVNNPSVSTPGTPTYAEVLGFPGAILSANADIGAKKFAMTAEVWEKLAATDKASGAAQFVLNTDTQKCIGFDFEVSEQVSANTLWFGVWSQLVLGMWGALDITVDTSTFSNSGTVRLVALQDVDVFVRQPTAFAYNSTVTL
jgi:HK97 family phage major capsid protein